MSAAEHQLGSLQLSPEAQNGLEKILGSTSNMSSQMRSPPLQWRRSSRPPLRLGQTASRCVGSTLWLTRA
jgi:hypothetical protein